jgi:hypothetical protein
MVDGVAGIVQHQWMVGWLRVLKGWQLVACRDGVACVARAVHMMRWQVVGAVGLSHLEGVVGGCVLWHGVVAGAAGLAHRGGVALWLLSRGGVTSGWACVLTGWHHGRACMRRGDVMDGGACAMGWRW